MPIDKSFFMIGHMQNSYSWNPIIIFYNWIYSQFLFVKSNNWIPIIIIVKYYSWPGFCNYSRSQLGPQPDVQGKIFNLVVLFLDQNSRNTTQPDVHQGDIFHLVVLSCFGSKFKKYKSTWCFILFCQPFHWHLWDCEL